MGSDRTSKVDLDAALLDPTAVFARPEEVRDHDALTREQKIEILRRWEYGLKELSVADEEGMSLGADPTETLAAVLDALAALEDPPGSPSSPTRHRGS